MANNLSTRPGSNIAPPPPPARNPFARVLSFLKRPFIVFIVLAIIIGVGTLVSILAAQASKKESTPTAVAVKVTPGVKAGAIPTATVQPSPTPDGIIKVFITGEVKKPGVYEMHDGDRIIDAVKVAGGFTASADPDRVDQAQRVRDEMRIEIPARPATPVPVATALPGQTQAANAAPTPAQVLPTATPADTRLNINTASAADLDKLPGIGEVLSQRIVDFRTKNGPFRTPEDLRKVQGLSASEIEKIKDLIVF